MLTSVPASSTYKLFQLFQLSQLLPQWFFVQPRCQASARKRLDLQQESAAGCCRLMLRRSPMVQWSQPQPEKNMGGYHGGPLGSCLCSAAKCFAGTWRLPSGCSCGWACGWCIPFLASVCWWLSMSLGVKITILCYTFGLNRVHQVPLVYHHFPHWNWSLKVRLIFLDKLMFFSRGLFEAFLCVCVCGSCVHQTSNPARNLHLFKCFHRLLRVSSPSAVSSPDADQWEGSFQICSQYIGY